MVNYLAIRILVAVAAGTSAASAADATVKSNGGKIKSCNTKSCTIV